MALTPALAVDGGVIPAALLRRLAFKQSKGQSGIDEPTDLRVTALATPGDAVNIAPGGVTMATRYTKSGRSEAYTTWNDATEAVEIPATGSDGGRTEYVIVRVDDWHFTGGEEPADPETALYCKFERVSSLAGLDYPFAPLAKLTIPASTATITNAMIEDLRVVANPRTEFEQVPRALVVADAEQLTQTRDDGEFFPNAGGVQTFDIPDWATYVSIRCEWSGLLLPRDANTSRLWVGFGDKDTATRYEINTQEYSVAGEASANAHRVGATVADLKYVPAHLRGQSVPFASFGRVVTGPGPTMDSLTGMIWQVQFLEVADKSDS